MAAFLLDIEGTTTAISFVTDTLFPYAAARIPDYLAAHRDPATDAARAAILADATADERALGGDAAVVAVVRRQMAADAKANGLKQLQGLVWQDGYAAGAIKGHLFPDVAPTLARWRDAGSPVAIYSSGSVLAQQLIFGHSVAGDLRPFISGWHDTARGPKREAASYATIAAAWGIAPAEITFATDQPAEATAAVAAGMRAVVLMRPGNAPLPANLPFAVHADLTRL
jgi:enolase-phosphatase E1